MKKQAALSSPLEWMLLATICEEPRSGYEIRKLIASTPMGHFSDSPGSVYPALQRLARRGFIRPEAEFAGKRKRHRYAATRKGTRALKQWFAQPITRDDVMRRVHELVLRFAFMDSRPRAEKLEFLRSMEESIATYLVELKQFFNSIRKHMPATGRLAVENGIEGYEATLRWARRARKELASV